MQRLLGAFALLVAAVALAACGRPTAEETAVAPTAPVAPPATVTMAPTTQPSPTAAPLAGATAAATSPTNTPLPTTSDGIVFSRTPEGYHVLGDPNAPVTLTMYSDFL